MSVWSPVLERSQLLMGQRLLNGRSEICWLSGGSIPVLKSETLFAAFGGSRDWPLAFSERSDTGCGELPG